MVALTLAAEGQHVRWITSTSFSTTFSSGAPIVKWFLCYDLDLPTASPGPHTNFVTWSGLIVAEEATLSVVLGPILTTAYLGTLDRWLSAPCSLRWEMLGSTMDPCAT